MLPEKMYSPPSLLDSDLTSPLLPVPSLTLNTWTRGHYPRHHPPTGLGIRGNATTEKNINYVILSSKLCLPPEPWHKSTSEPEHVAGDSCFETMKVSVIFSLPAIEHGGTVKYMTGKINKIGKKRFNSFFSMSMR